MISIQKQFLFIHVPKTGGNSIQNILRDYSEDDIVVLYKHQDGFERFEVRNSKYNIKKHSTISHYKSVLDFDIYRSLFKFATIRNPWDMMISFYFSPHRGVTEWDRDNFLALMNTVPNLRKFICEESLIDRVLKKLGAQKYTVKKQLDADIDFVMKFERIEQDFKVICEKLDIPHSPLPKRNASTRTHYSKYYDDELREK
ncbi:MAG: sulfotransferase family 2 domain-containing protein, partial [Candidatus Omnitrophica bacterium]|nr:sulfotransferase family 2 domain-containing protein [Candidatus Omnitrophota bacterium]